MTGVAVASIAAPQQTPPAQTMGQDNSQDNAMTPDNSTAPDNAMLPDNGMAPDSSSTPPMTPPDTTTPPDDSGTTNTMTPPSDG